MKACEILRSGSPVILSTDTVPGLFCLYDDTKALETIRRLKGRDGRKPFQVWISSFKYLKELGVDASESAFLKEYLPGPYTIVVRSEKKLKVSDNGLIGIRMGRNHLINDLIEKCGPLASTSLNLSGTPYDSGILLRGDFKDIRVFGDLPQTAGMPSTVIKRVPGGISIIRYGGGILKIEKDTIVMGSDHAGFELKEKVKDYLKKKGITFADMGTFDEGSVDYPLIASKVAKQVQSYKCRGILICGTGIGMSIAANRFTGVRAALCHIPEYAELARRHNAANILVMGGRFLGEGLMHQVVDKFLGTAFDGGRHQRRVDRIEEV